MVYNHEMLSFCAEIGTNRLLVQGAGGNASWKENNTLWIKASGMWLVDAKSYNIFLPIDLGQLRENLARNDFEVKPLNLSESNLRPSIETFLHVLMPWKFVLHTHSVNILTILVRKNALKEIKDIMKNRNDWVFIDYFKPGSNLARAVHSELYKNPLAHIVFMKNHGLVIGAETVQELSVRLQEIENLFYNEIKYNYVLPKNSPEIEGYSIVDKPEVQALVKHDRLFKRIKEDWVLYPDHVIFLDAVAKTNIKEKPLNLFLKDVAVYQKNEITRAAKAQLLCYADVMIRQGYNDQLTSLSDYEINQLINWDAEKYRKKLNDSEQKSK
jgi:rhamnose utilization protein RhaD (predicted bifunctional aldolase and dehydrogenase)